MKNEEKLLDALGDVKSSYILECSQYVGNSQQEVLLVKPKRRWAHLSAIAAVMALFITATLVLLPQVRRGNLQSASALSSIINLGDGTALKLVTKVAESEDAFSSIEEIAVYRGNVLLQTIDPSCLPTKVENHNEGLFVSISGNVGHPDFRDLNFDGYTDIGFPALGREAENLPYHYFLWNPEQSKYEYSFTLLGASALVVNQENQELEETAFVYPEPILRYYRFENGSLKQMTWTSTAIPNYQISYDTNRFAMTSGDGGNFIAPLYSVGTYTPVCEIQIEFLPNQLPSGAAKTREQELTALGIPDSKLTRQPQQDDRIALHVEYGTQWDSAVEDIYFVSAGASGTFRLTSRYFLEAAEGYGATFADICSSFQPAIQSANWKAEQTVTAFADGFFSGDWAAMEPYLYDPNGEMSQEDVYTGNAAAIQLVKLSGLEQLDASIRETGSATVSLTFLELETDEAYTSLSMDVVKTDEGYRIRFYGLEK